MYSPSYRVYDKFLLKLPQELHPKKRLVAARFNQNNSDLGLTAHTYVAQTHQFVLYAAIGESHRHSSN